MNAVFCYATLPKELLLKTFFKLKSLNINLNAIVTHYGDLKTVNESLKDVKSYCISDYNNPATWAEWIKYNIYSRPRSIEKTWTEPFDNILFDKLVRPNITRYLPITERYGPFEGGSIESETRLMFDFSIAHHIVNTHNPSLMFFYLEPQTSLENMLYLLAKHFNIKTFVVRSGLFRHQCALSQSFDTPLVDEHWKPHSSLYKIETNIPKDKELLDRTLEVINKIAFPKDKYEPQYMQGLEFFKSKKEIVRELIKSKFQRNLFIQFGFEPPYGSLLKYQLYRNYGHSVAYENYAEKSPLIFFPLHYQPELNTMPRGGEYVNQLKAIKFLSDALPSNGHILVKEHPSVFSKIHHVNKNFRPGTFYNWISRLPNVSLVPIEISSEKLQNECDFIATITGNAGLEAMIRGKKVLAFGYASYLNGPGVYQIKSNDLLKKYLLENTPNRNFIDENAYEKSLNFIKSISANCYHTDLEFNSKLFVNTRLNHWTNTLLSGLKNLYG